MEKRTFIILLAVFALIILANSLFALSTRPRFCGVCHGKDYQTWAKSVHRQTQCNYCHQRPGFLGFAVQRLRVLGMAGAFSSGLYERPVTASVDSGVCLSCHAKIEKQSVVKNALRVSHREILSAGYECGYCHSQVPHGAAVPSPRTTTMGKCLECHNGDTARSDCTVCHLEGAKRGRIARDDPWRITHGKNWRQIHGMGDSRTCNVCHSKAYCARCHQVELPHPEGFVNLHGKVAKPSIERCYSCHAKSLCDSCHQMPMPHPTNFLPEHSKIVKSGGDTLCLRCHMKAGCDACHEQHIHRAVFWFEGRPKL